MDIYEFTIANPLTSYIGHAHTHTCHITIHYMLCSKPQHINTAAAVDNIAGCVCHYSVQGLSACMLSSHL